MKGASDNERFIGLVTETSAEPSTDAAVAGSSSDNSRDLRVDDHEQAEDIVFDQNVDGAISGGMDLDVVESNIVEGIQ